MIIYMKMRIFIEINMSFFTKNSASDLHRMFVLTQYEDPPPAISPLTRIQIRERKNSLRCIFGKMGPKKYNFFLMMPIYVKIVSFVCKTGHMAQLILKLFQYTYTYVCITSFIHIICIYLNGISNMRY